MTAVLARGLSPTRLRRLPDGDTLGTYPGLGQWPGEDACRLFVGFSGIRVADHDAMWRDLREEPYKTRLPRRRIKRRLPDGAQRA